MTAETLKRCKVSRYDESITIPPFELIQVGSFEVYEPQIDHLGVDFANRLWKACEQNGFVFKFYSRCSDDNNFDYEVVVY